MKKINVQLFFISGITFSVFLISCRKSDFLNAKPIQSQVVPTTLTDFQALLDADYIMNGEKTSGIVPSLGQIGSDDYFILDANYTSFAQVDKNEYTWAANPYPGLTMQDWNSPYKSILTSNVVLDGLTKTQITPDQQSTWNNIEGSALFYRAHSFYQLAQVFASAYDSSTARTDLGIPLRLSSDINEKIIRSNVKETYDQILKDLLIAKSLLPVTPLYKTRPSKTAAFGLLARVYESMNDYNNAFLYADSCLQLQSSLMNYSTYSQTTNFPFPAFNSEVIFDCLLIRPTDLSPSYTKVDTILYNSYSANDLRKVLFYKSFAGYYRFLGSYSASAFHFAGIATDEVYLIRAECYARKGNVLAAMNDLNTLLQTRWRPSTFVPYTAVDAVDALNQILIEKRKELVFRGLRWTDIRRLNKLGANITIKRIVQGQTYTLAPNDLRYAWLIPDDVVSFNSGMQQNPR